MTDLALRQWFLSGDALTIRLTRIPEDDYDLSALHSAIRAFVCALSDGPLGDQDGRISNPGMNTNHSLPKSVDPKVLSIVRAGEPKPRFSSIEGDD